jgi:hypothetical protein
MNCWWDGINVTTPWLSSDSGAGMVVGVGSIMVAGLSIEYIIDRSC